MTSADTIPNSFYSNKLPSLHTSSVSKAYEKNLNKTPDFFFCLCATTTKMDGKPKKPDISEQKRIEMESSWELLSEKLQISESWKVCNVTNVNLHYSQTPH